MEAHFTAAAQYLGSSVIDHGHHTRQALILCNGAHAYKYSLGSVNRNINPIWKDEMKKVIRDLHARRERTIIYACIDTRSVQASLEDAEAATFFTAIVLEGQHRMTALQDLLLEDPSFATYEFWVVLYLIQSDAEMHQLLKDLDRRCAFKAEDISTVDLRLRFTRAFNELVKGHDRRRCIQGTLNHTILRDPVILSALKQYTEPAIRSMILKAAAKYKPTYEMAGLRQGVLMDTIEKTKLYQLIEWQSGAWIREMLLADA